MQTPITAAFNLRSDGTIVEEGVYGSATSIGLPLSEAGLKVQRLSVGRYQVSAPGIAIPEGWRATVFRDENDLPTIRIVLAKSGDDLVLATNDPETGEPKDIVHLLTLRVGLVIDVPTDGPSFADFVIPDVGSESVVE